MRKPKLMQTQTKIKVERTAASGLDKIDFAKLEFGKTPSDHMFISEYYDGDFHNERDKVSVHAKE